MTKYQIRLKSGVTQVLDNLGNGKNPIGLWIWSSRQAGNNILTFMDEVTGAEIGINANDIAMMVKIDKEEKNHRYKKNRGRADIDKVY